MSISKEELTTMFLNFINGEQFKNIDDVAKFLNIFDIKDYRDSSESIYKVFLCNPEWEKLLTNEQVRFVDETDMLGCRGFKLIENSGYSGAEYWEVMEYVPLKKYVKIAAPCGRTTGIDWRGALWQEAKPVQRTIYEFVY